MNRIDKVMITSKSDNNETIAVLTRYDAHVTTRFLDGTESSNWPLPEHDDYVQTAWQCGFSRDHLLDYVMEHELLHTLLPLRLTGYIGYTITRSAAQKPINRAASMCEEKLIYYFQRYLCGATHCIDPEWEHLRDEVHRLLYPNTNRVLNSYYRAKQE